MGTLTPQNVLMYSPIVQNGRSTGKAAYPPKEEVGGKDIGHPRGTDVRHVSRDREGPRENQSASQGEKRLGTGRGAFHENGYRVNRIYIFRAIVHYHPHTILSFCISRCLYNACATLQNVFMWA